MRGISPSAQPHGAYHQGYVEYGWIFLCVGKLGRSSNLALSYSCFRVFPLVDLGSDLDLDFMIVVQHRPVVVDVALLDFTAVGDTFITKDIWGGGGWRS